MKERARAWKEGSREGKIDQEKVGGGGGGEGGT